MSKKLLRTININQARIIKQSNSKNGMKIKQGNIKTGNVNPTDSKKILNAFKTRDIETLNKFFGKDTRHLTTKESYMNIPDIKILKQSSIKSLKVVVYSSEAHDNTLLHSIFTKVRKHS